MESVDKIYFVVSIGGEDQARFSDATEVVQHSRSLRDDFAGGRELILKRGTTEKKEFSEWITSYRFGKPKNMVLYIRRNGINLAAWQYMNAWSFKYTMSDLKAAENEVAFASIEFSYSSRERIILTD